MVATSILELKPFVARINIVDILAFISINAKYYYDKYYKPIFLKDESFVFLRLYKDYNISTNTAIIKKLG